MKILTFKSFLMITYLAIFCSMQTTRAASKKPIHAVLSLGDGFEKFEFQTSTLFEKSAQVTEQALKNIPKVDDLQRMAVASKVFSKPAEFYNCVKSGVQTEISSRGVGRRISAEAYAGICSILGSPSLTSGQGTLFLFGKRSATDPKVEQDVLVVVDETKRRLLESYLRALNSPSAITGADKKADANVLNLDLFCTASSNFQNKACQEISLETANPSKCLSVPGGQNAIDITKAGPLISITEVDGNSSGTRLTDPRQRLTSLNGWDEAGRKDPFRSKIQNASSKDQYDCVKCPKGTHAVDDACRDSYGCDALTEKFNSETGKCESVNACGPEIFSRPHDCGDKGDLAICKMVAGNIMNAVTHLDLAGGSQGTINLDNQGANILVPYDVVIPLRGKPDFRSLISGLQFEFEQIQACLGAKSPNCKQKDCLRNASQLESQIQSVLSKTCDGIWGPSVSGDAFSSGSERFTCYPNECARCAQGNEDMQAPISARGMSRIGNCSEHEIQTNLYRLQAQISSEANRRTAICMATKQPEICNFKTSVTQADLTAFMQAVGIRCASPQVGSKSKSKPGTR